MATRFKTVIDAAFLGKSRKAGEFQDNEGVEVRYGDKYRFEFEDSEGVSQVVEITDKALKEVGCNPLQLKKYGPVRIEGDVVLNADKPGFFRPVQVTAPKAS